MFFVFIGNSILQRPLFCEAELNYNEKFAEGLRIHSYDVLSPQELNNDVEKIIATDSDTAYSKIFDSDIKALKSCDILIMVMDGGAPDEVSRVELGIAYCSGIEFLGVKTDVQTSEYGTDSFMLNGALKGRVAKYVEELCSMMGSASIY